jgi:hypothetical protein
MESTRIRIIPQPDYRISLASGNGALFSTSSWLRTGGARGEERAERSESVSQSVEQFTYDLLDSLNLIQIFLVDL